MNAHDRANLEFLLTIHPSDIEEFWNQASPDDIAYAHELIILAQAEFALREQALDEYETGDLSQAHKVLTRIMAL